MKKAHGFTLIELLIVVAIIGIIAAVAIPSLLRARVSANESATQGDVRTVISAASAYEATSGGNGYPKSSTCFAEPGEGNCIPGYDTTAPSFLDSNLAKLALTKSGYQRSWLVDGTNPVGNGVDGFCYLAQPTALNRTGTRSFAGDAAGIIGGSQGKLACCSATSSIDLAACPALN